MVTPTSPRSASALALDPSLTEAQRGLARAQWMVARRRWTRAAEALAGALALAFALWLLWRRTGTPKSAAPTAT